MTADTSRESPPGPDGLPVVGNALEERRRPFAFRTENARRYGDVVYWEFVNRPIYDLYHPEYIEYVLVHENEKFVKGDFFQEVIGSFLGDGLLNSEGETWRRQRRLIQPLFHPDQIRRNRSAVVRSVEQVTAAWDDGQRVDIHEEMMALMLRVITATLLGVDLERDIDAIGRNLDTILSHVDTIKYQLLPSWLPTPSNREFNRAIEELDAVVHRIITERAPDPTADDMVSRLLAVRDDDGEALSATELRDQVMTFLLAGHETTALSLTYTWYLLATHPRVERQLLEEFDRVLDGAPPSAETADELGHADRVLTESMRLYPPVSRFFREATEDVEIGGYEIPAGANVSLPQWVVHRDPRWYDDPLAFRPDRWTEDFRSALPKLAYFPFSAGPRRCIGDRFSRMTATTVLATILQSHHLELCPDTDFELEMTVTTRPANPVWVTVHER
ncbi:MAG: cytochrome P450 [Halobacteriales archaeon]